MKNNTLIWIIVLLILAVGIILFASKINILAFGGTGNLVTDMKLESDNSQSATYTFDFSSDAPSSHGCESQNSLNVNLNILCSPYSGSSTPVLADNLQLNTYFPADSVTINGAVTTNPCTGIEGEGGGSLTFDLKSECQIRQYSIPGSINHACIDCRITGTAVPSQPGFIYGGNSGKITVKFLKQGIECLEGDKCINSEYFLCQNNKWINKGKTAGKCGIECVNSIDCVSGYSCIENKCVKPGECLDKVNMCGGSCPLCPEPPDYLIIILSVAGFLGVVGLLIWVYMKTRK